MANQKKGSKHFDFTKDNKIRGGRFDFTKDELEKTHFQKYGKWYRGGVIAVACIVAVVAFGPDVPPQSPVADDPVIVDATAVAEIDTVSTPTETTESSDKVTNEDGAKPITEKPMKPKGISVTIPQVLQNEDIIINAKKAIRGDFGNGAERPKNLGANYDKVQTAVNKMYREGNLYW